MGINKKSCEKLAENGGSAMMRDIAPGFEKGALDRCDKDVQGRGLNKNNNGSGTTNSSVRVFSAVDLPPDIQ